MWNQNKGKCLSLQVKIEILIKNGWYRFIYCLFLAIDANFHLKRKSVSSDVADPSLIDGKAYFVQENFFKDFLSEYGSKVVQEVRSLFSVNAWKILTQRIEAQYMFKPQRRQCWVILHRASSHWCRYNWLFMTWHQTTDFCGGFTKRRKVSHLFFFEISCWMIVLDMWTWIIYFSIAWGMMM